MRIHRTITSVLEIFGTIDGQVAAFQLATGLHCPSGCGSCCLSDKVRTTPVEMLPAAAEILRCREEDRWLNWIDGSGRDGVCAGYAPCPPDICGGHCRLYKWRPSICRLFGFAAVAGKHGQPELAACKHLKQFDPIRVERSREAVRSGLDVPIFTAYSLRLAALAPSLGTTLIPINQALRLAIEHLGLIFGLEGPPANLSAKRKHAA